jgi:hypothetical protein
MKIASLCKVFLLLIVSLFFDSGRASAQAPLEPAQMPPRTVFYLIWRGAPSLDATKANALLSLWGDPDFAPARTALLDNLLSGSEKDNSRSAPLTREELEQYSTLFENPFTMGYISEPEKYTDAADAAEPSKTSAHIWAGRFFVYDRTGKEALLTKAVLRLRAQEKDVPQISQISIGGAQVLKVERKTGITYWTETGKYAVSSNERSVLEEVLARLNEKAPARSSLAQTAAYREAALLLGGGLLEFFVRVQGLKDLTADASASGFRIQPILEALKIESVHSFCSRVTLEGTKTRVQGAVLGDAAPGALFDIWAEGQQSPASLALVTSGTISYNDTQINAQGVYDAAKRAFRAFFPQGQQGSADLLEALAQSRLGMPLPEALALVTGEFASLQTSPALDPANQVIFLGIRKKPEILKLIRTIFGDQLTSERSEDDATYLKISLRGGQNDAGVAQWNFYNLAVTPDAILGASRSQTLRDLLAHRTLTPAEAGFLVSPQLQTARAQFPEKLNGVSFFDFQKVDWQAFRDRWLAEAKTAEAKAPKTGAKTSNPHGLDWLEQINTQVFSRHLHFASSASWKDAKGLHYDGWLE